MGPKTDDTDVKLIGYGLGGILILVIIFGVELFNGPPPSISSLQSFSGQLVSTNISRDRNRIFAEIQVRNGTQEVVLFQQVSEQLSVDIQKLPLGKTVTALIVPKDFIDQRTGLMRHSMWQLAIGEQEIFSYKQITQYINGQTTSWRIFSYCAGAIGIACFTIVGLRRLRRARP